MINASQKIIKLKEYQPERFDRDEISLKDGESLWHHYKEYVNVEFPSIKTDNKWELKAQGWVGYIPLSPETGISLQPKVRLNNLFRMLEYAYKLKSFRFLEGIIGCQSLQEFYERLANVLGKKILERGRKGFYRTYLSQTDHLPYLRGQLDLIDTIKKPWMVKLKCNFEDHTADIEENQILAWTISQIARSGLCSERVLPTIRRSYRALQGLTSLNPFSPSFWVNRRYNRLNNDYEPMHALCRFFLEHRGPSHQMGDRKMLPFLVDMAHLFELFVAEWLKAHLPPNWRLESHEKVIFSDDKSMHFDIDLVLYNLETANVHCVLDTKYKVSDKSITKDIEQIVAYAESKNCQQAVLIYPTKLTTTLNAMIGKKRVRTISFSIEEDLEKGGHAFLDKLLFTDDTQRINTERKIK